MPEETVVTTGATNGNDQTQSSQTENTSQGTDRTDGENKTTTSQSENKTEAKVETKTEGKKETTPTWPADWRQQMAGEDKDYIKQLERYASPQDLVKKIKEQEKLIATTRSKDLPKDATPEQIAAWRKENNIPEASDKYDLSLPDGLTIGENDKPIVGKMLETMHGMNLNNDQVKNILASYYSQQSAFMQERENQLAAQKVETEDALRKEWGGEYRGEINRIENLLNTYSKETQEALQFGTDRNGMPLLNNPNVLRDLALQARLINPVSTVVANGGTNQADSVDTEIAAIEKRMSEDRDGYFKDQKAQARYLELLDWRENQKVKR